MTRTIFHAHRTLFEALIAMGVAAGCAAIIRFFVIEVHEIGLICDGGTGPWWCLMRQGVYQAFRIWPIGLGALGMAGLLAGMAALLQGGRAAGIIAAALSVTGCILYNADTAAIGLALALMAAARHDDKR